jgi:hypothetical protein
MELNNCGGDIYLYDVAASRECQKKSRCMHANPRMESELMIEMRVARGSKANNKGSRRRRRRRRRWMK